MPPAQQQQQLRWKGAQRAAGRESLGGFKLLSSPKKVLKVMPPCQLHGQRVCLGGWMLRVPVSLHARGCQHRVSSKEEESKRVVDMKKKGPLLSGSFSMGRNSCCCLASVSPCHHGVPIPGVALCPSYFVEHTELGPCRLDVLGIILPFFAIHFAIILLFSHPFPTHLLASLPSPSVVSER